MSNGLVNSLTILEFLRKSDELNKIDIHVECFINCRECGLTFTVYNKDWSKKYTFCIYEHRNTDSIIINGKADWTSIAGDLPYQEKDYIKGFAYNQHYQCAEKLQELILEFYNKNK
jgi:hypothetical protein